MATTRPRPRTRLRPPPEIGSTPVTFQGETAYYTLDELRMIASWRPTEENENAARFIHAAKVHLDATLVG